MARIYIEKYMYIYVQQFVSIDYSDFENIWVVIQICFVG